MKIFINFEPKNGPWGGGNQFIKALKNQFLKEGIYTDKPAEADVILFNSHHNLDEVVDLKTKYPNKLFLHRIDGPIQIVREVNDGVDAQIFEANNRIADITIFQSYWSFKQTIMLGFIPKNPNIISNASNPDIFNISERINYDGSSKFKIISTSWSSNPKKGGSVYKWLDDNLDFTQYEYTFLGNTDQNFTNIKKLDPLDSSGVASLLKESDIFITASKDDPCSNSLIEALSCGLPAIYAESGGHPEIVKAAGLGFYDQKEIIENLLNIKKNYTMFQSLISVPSIDEISKEYVNFAKKFL